MKKFTLVIFAILIVAVLSLSYSQSLYDINTIQKIEIKFTESDWDYKLDTAKAGSESYIMAQSVTINDIKYDSVGVKYKGNSTYNANQKKNPFHIELDTYKEQDYEGYTDLKLSNVAKDPSFVREVLSYSILRQYMSAPLSNYANVYVNGSLIGLFVSSESVGKKFVQKHFGSKANTFIKCNPIDGAGQGTTTLPNLTYLGTDSASYNKAYELNSTYGWVDLIKLANTLKNDITNIETILDVDKALWMLAYDNATVNLDSYIGQFAQNYYLYKADNGRFNCVLWDFNEGFGSFSQSGSGSYTTTSSKSKMSHTLHSGDASWPLVQKLLAVPSYKKRYIAHMQTIMSENFASGTYKTWGQSYQTVIDAAVQADPNKFFSYTYFKSNLTSDASTAPGISALMGARNTYLSALSDFTATKPTISEVTTSVVKPEINSTFYVTAKVDNATTSSVYLAYRRSEFDVFTKVLMSDNGTTNDGTANDKTYGAAVSVNSSLMQYYIYAENTNAGTFSPARAEYEFYSVELEPVKTSLVLNEIYARGTSADPDWIEIYNGTDASVNIGGYKVYDSGGYAGTKPQKEFPANTIIPSKGYYVIVTDDDSESSFGLSNSGEKVWFANASGVVIDSVSYLDHSSIQSYSRMPDGGNWDISTTITRGYSNDIETAIKSVEILATPLELKCYPNPFKNSMSIQFTLENTENVVLSVYDLQGVLIEQLENKQLSQGQYEYNFNPGNAKSGIYILRMQTANSVNNKKIAYVK